MGNRIRDVAVVNHRLDPHETELRVVVDIEGLTPTTQIKGRLIGPRNVYRSTVEVAYPLREIERGKHIVLQAFIPEACWWEPKTPFLYQGPLELWQDGLFCERVEISHGIRTVQLTSKGLRLNGRPFVLRGRIARPPCSDADARRAILASVFEIAHQFTQRLIENLDRRANFFQTLVGNEQNGANHSSE